MFSDNNKFQYIGWPRFSFLSSSLAVVCSFSLKFKQTFNKDQMPVYYIVDMCLFIERGRNVQKYYDARRLNENRLVRYYYLKRRSFVRAHIGTPIKSIRIRNTFVQTTFEYLLYSSFKCHLFFIFQT